METKKSLTKHLGGELELDISTMVIKLVRQSCEKDGEEDIYIENKEDLKAILNSYRDPLGELTLRQKGSRPKKAESLLCVKTSKRLLPLRYVGGSWDPAQYIARIDRLNYANWASGSLEDPTVSLSYKEFVRLDRPHSLYIQDIRKISVERSEDRKRIRKN
ncbi:hypothetical protein HOA55_01980 [archaeon]|jgi:hypothetical protein|nr:hypothetical protein [archaeon]MBT6820100.1 hypothetical protein [archaeon]MBT7025381.1 hypothetical protein [archaeon]MBT7568152.1 hypothetical protein [archaeon]MBT7705968.1 hypothetical protein [archaeon]